MISDLNHKEPGCKTFSKIYLEDSKKLEIFALLLNTLVDLNRFLCHDKYEHL